MFPDFEPGPIIPLLVLAQKAEECDFAWETFGAVLTANGKMFLGEPGPEDWSTLITLEQMSDLTERNGLTLDDSPFLIMFLKEGENGICWSVVSLATLEEAGIPFRLCQPGN